MYFLGLDLNLLVVLDALIEDKNISRAGERIHLSQPATSGALARLREYFHDELLVSAGRKMRLTPLAESLALPIRELLAEVQDLIQKTPVFAPETCERTFRIVVSDYVAAVLMTRAIPEIQRQAPRITIEILAPAADALDRGEADLLVMPHQRLSPNHPTEALFQDEFVCVVCASNRYVKRRLSLKTYLSLPHVAIRFGEHQDVSSVEEYSSAQTSGRRIEVVITGFTLVPQTILKTPRIATIPKRLAELYAERLPLKVFKVPHHIPPVVETMQWHTLRSSDPALLWLRGILKAAAQ